MQEYTFSSLKPLTQLAVIYIKNHLNENITVKETAKALNVSADYLSHQFSTDMNMNFIEFLNQERVKQAASLLKHTDLRIQDIAAVVGFNHTSYFSKQFVKLYHQSPRDYRINGEIL